MDASEYQKQAARTLVADYDVSQMAQDDLMVIWTVFGLAGETGELVEVVKKGIFHRHGLDLQKVRKEVGDCLWYLAAICSRLDIDMSDIMQENIDKLRIRYPNGFSSQDSVRRVDVKEA